MIINNEHEYEYYEHDYENYEHDYENYEHDYANYEHDNEYYEHDYDIMNTWLWYYEHDYDIMNISKILWIDNYHIMNMTMSFMNTSITVIKIILMIKSSKNKHLNLSFFIGWGLLALDLAEVFLYIKKYL